jgi:tetratricopeptide (TPR) repeat protein
MKWIALFHHQNVIKGYHLLILDMKRAVLFTFLLSLGFTFLFGLWGCTNKKNEQDTRPLSEDLSSLTKQFPDSIPLQLQYHQQIFINGDQKGAMEGLMKLAEKYPTRIDLLNELAALSLENMDTALSIHFLNQSMDINAKQSDAAFMLAGIYAAQKNPNWKKITEHLIHQKEDPIAAAKGYYLTGIQLSNENKIKEAITAFEKAIILNYTFTDAYIEKAILLFDSDHTDQAIDLLYKAQEMDRKSADIPFWLGECYLKKKNKEKAMAFFEQTQRLDPDYQAAIDRIANIKY